MKELTKEDYIEALKKLEKSPSDRVGLLGELGVDATGALAGALGAGAVASFFGGTTILGSSALAGFAGGILVASTPIGWVLGTAAAGTAAAYGIAKLVKSGGVNDERKNESIVGIKEKIAALRAAVQSKKKSDFIGQLSGSFSLLMEKDLISKEEVTSIMQGIENGIIDSDSAFSIVNSLLDEITSIDNNLNNLDKDKFAVRSSFVLLLKHMINIDGSVMDSELETYKNIMQIKFKCSSSYAEKLFSEAPRIDNIDKTLQELKNILNTKQITLLIETLVEVAFSDGEYIEIEKVFIEEVKNILSA